MRAEWRVSEDPGNPGPRMTRADPGYLWSFGPAVASTGFADVHKEVHVEAVAFQAESVEGWTKVLCKP